MTGWQDAGRRLIAALATENLALERLDLQAASLCLEEKQAAIAALPSGPPPPSTTLLEIARQLRSLGDENRRLLERAISVQSRVLSVVRAAAAGRGGDPSYRPGGARARGPSAPLSLMIRA
jgi:hypothetical protein